MLVLKSIAITFGVLLVVAAAVLYARPTYQGRRAGFADENYLKSGDCRSCHAGHYASWARTFHSRMTQEARPASVQGDFENQNSYEYLGVKARMEKRGDAFFMTFNFPDGRTQTASIDRTVGSRRIEQYLTREAGQYTRLPLAYDLVNQRWMSLNGSFFYPDNDNYFQHVAQWDGNCVFCHNVKAQPHINFKTRQFDTEVAELGIACGACHGPAAVHAEAALSPLTRTLWHLDETGNKQIVHPLKLPAERSMMICGHCHGQRVPEPFDRIQSILTSGDPYNAGDDLSAFYRPITTRRLCGVFGMCDQPGGLTKLRVTRKARSVAAIFSRYLPFRIATMHRMARQAINLFARFTFAEAFRTEDALVFVSREPRTAVSPKAIGKRDLAYV